MQPSGEVGRFEAVDFPSPPADRHRYPTNPMAIERNISIRVWEHPVESLPFDLLEILSEEELSAYAEGAPYFQRLAASSGCTALKQLLDNADHDQPMFVDLKKSDDSPWYVWFGFTFPSMSFNPRLRLAKPIRLPSNSPVEIKQFYKAFGGICESSFIGGFMPPERILLGANHFIMDRHLVGLPDNSYPWFDFGNGDYAGWLPSGNAFMYDHGTGDITETDFSDLCNMLYSEFSRSPLMTCLTSHAV